MCTDFLSKFLFNFSSKTLEIFIITFLIAMCSFAGVMELDDINKYYSLKKFIEENDIVEFEIQKGDWARQIYFIGNMLSDCRYQSLYFSKMKKNQHSDDYWPIIIFDDLLENEKDRPCDPFLKIIDRSNK